jgi:hypothetical protein
MQTFLEIKNRNFFAAMFIVWLLGLFFAKFDVAWNTTQSEIFKIPQFIINLLFLLWMLQKTVNSYRNRNSFRVVVSTLFWLIVVINVCQVAIKYFR